MFCNANNSFYLCRNKFTEGIPVVVSTMGALSFFTAYQNGKH